MSLHFLPFVDVVEDVSGGNVKTKQEDYLSKGAIPIIDQGRSLIGGYSDDPNSLCKSALPVVIFGDHTRALKFVDFPFGMGADGVKVLRPRSGLDAKYLYHYLRSVRLPDSGYDRHFKYLKRERVPIPPSVEQRRIAAILDQAETLCAKWRAAIGRLDQLPLAIFFDMFGDPIENHRNWPSASLSEVCQLYSGGTPSKANASFWRGDLPWFSAKDLKADDLFDSQDHIWEGVPQQTSLRLLPADTVAIVVRGMILAHTFPVSVLRVPATINQDLKALLPKKSINAQFLAACLRSQSKFVLGLVSEAGHGTKRLDSAALEKIRVLLPGRTLINAFAKKIEAIESVRNSYRAALAESKALFGSLQHRAFSGEL